jgi:hypothetical protein
MVKRNLFMSMLSANTLRAAAVLAVLPLAAPAATLYQTDLRAGDFYTNAVPVAPGSALEFRFNVLEALRIQAISLSATGNTSGDDVNSITFGYGPITTQHFSTIGTVGTTAFGGGFLPGATYAVGDSFSVFVNDIVTNPASLTLSFSTASVPVPAAGLLLGSVLLAGGAVARRRSRRA